MIGRGAALVLLLSLPARLAGAQDRTSICLWNVGGQAGMTLASAAIQHKIHGWRDIVRIAAAGSLSGLGIYEAKSLVGKDHPRTGWMVANLAGSLSENAAAGRHPVGQIGYTVGPVRLRKLLEVFKNPERVLGAKRGELRQVEGIGNEVADQISNWESTVDLAAELQRIREFGATVITQESSSYPKPLREIHAPPIVLYI